MAVRRIEKKTGALTPMPRPLSLPPSCTRDASTAAAAGSSAAEPSRTYGGLADEDRIFTNLYRQGDPFLKVST